jgi:hypothetical protein
MIFNTTEEKDVKQVGDIKNNNVSIDTNNIDFIVTILSTNLYSRPIESFIRETVSNAWDSHVEAGIDEPVILELGKDTEGNNFCRIQDFGVGLSPERFMNVYKNIGSSTKRGNNTQIGGFGIGRFSALAYNDVVHITSVFEGMKYQYMMYKDGNSISIDLLHEQESDERNGLEVKLDIKYGDFNNFANAIKSQLVYFENLYVIDSTGDSVDFNHTINIQFQYNNFSIKKYENFWVNTLDTSKEINLVLGKVRYPLRVGSLNKYYPGKVENYPISLIFDIGDLQVTPNREEILYSDQNKTLIEERLDLAVKEIEDLIAAEKSKDFISISEYINAINETQYLVLLENDTDKVKLKLTDSKRNLTLNGYEYDPKNFVAMHNLIMFANLATSQYTLTNNQIQYNNVSMSLNFIKDNFGNIFIGDLSDVKNISKRYIRETFPNRAYFIKGNKSFKSYARDYITEMKKKLKDTYGNSRDYTHFDKEAFKVIFLNAAKNVAKLPRFSDAKVPKKWIADTKAADKAKRGNIKKIGFDWKQNINFHELRPTSHGNGITTDSTAYVMKDLPKTFKKLTIYDEKDSSKLRTLFNYLNYDVKVNMVELAPTKLKLLKNVDNFVKLSKFMSTDFKLIRNIGTVEFLKKEIPFLHDLSKVSNIADISPKLATVVSELREFVVLYESSASRHSTRGEEQKLIDEIYDICEEKDYFNEEIRSLYESNKDELQNAKVLIDFANQGQYTSSSHSIPKNRVNLVVDYVLARKLFRPSIAAVLKLKKETIFNLISEEDENN